jgi:hypothetical protein
MLLGQISSGELAEVVMSIGIAIAQFSARYMPTVFVLDELAVSLDNSGLQDAVDRLSNSDINFQTIIAIPTREIDYSALIHLGGSVVWLDGKIPSVSIARHSWTPAANS